MASQQPIEWGLPSLRQAVADKWDYNDSFYRRSFSAFPIGRFIIRNCCPSYYFHTFRWGWCDLSSVLLLMVRLDQIRSKVHLGCSSLCLVAMSQGTPLAMSSVIQKCSRMTNLTSNRLRNWNPDINCHLLIDELDYFLSCPSPWRLSVLSGPTIVLRIIETPNVFRSRFFIITPETRGLLKTSSGLKAFEFWQLYQ